jgi:amino acid adenylation domain-containing protein
MTMRAADSLGEREYQTLIVEYNNTGAPYPAEKTIVELFETQAERTPNAEAVRIDEQSLSYRELNARANQLAARLGHMGAGPERFVALYMEHSIEVVCAILGVLKSGAAYVPVDPATTPRERLAFKMQDLSDSTAASKTPLILITQSRLMRDLPFQGAEVVTLDSDFVQIEQYPTLNLPKLVSPSNAAYVIYTSGSTGKPKGVLIEHRSLTNYIWWAKQKYCGDERLVWPLFSPLSFDLTVTSIFTPLISGGRIVIYGEEPETRGKAILEIIEKGVVDIVKLTPSHLAMIQNMDLKATRIRKLVVGGEDFKTGLAHAITKQFGRPVEIYNEYGPTEATVGCMIHRYDSKTDLGISVPIGIPAANSGVYILDEHFQPVPTGFVGEMYLAGDGLAREYLNQPDLTEQKFLVAKDPRLNGNGAGSTSSPQLLRLYKTGDVARWSAEGHIEFLGRADEQIKIGGIRIELGEIEACLKACPWIQDGVVDVFHAGRKPLVSTELPAADQTVVEALVAYYVSEKPLTVAEVRAQLARQLPDYMVPAYVVRLEELPLTPNGKIDRKALPVPTYEHMQSSCEFVPPRTQTEKTLAQIWTELLNIEQIGIYDDFFDLGNSSLVGVWAILRIQEEFGGVDLPMRTIFDNPTISSLSAALDQIREP